MDSDPGRTVRVNGADRWYRERGAGEPLVLLHGFMDCGSAWDLFVELRRRGRSTNPAGTFTMRQSSDDVLAVLDSLRLPRVHAMGISAWGQSP